MKPLPEKAFQRRKEDFTCGNCGTFVEGDGYRNHCPACLYSRHVDIAPGDRLHECGGLMPVGDVEMKHGKIVFIHVCGECGEEKKNRVHVEDDRNEITRVMRVINDAKPM